MTLQRRELLNRLADSIGKSKAQDALQRAASQTGIRLSGELSKDEAFEILESIAEDDESGTLTTVSANTAMTHIRSMN